MRGGKRLGSRMPWRYVDAMGYLECPSFDSYYLMYKTGE